MREPSLHVYRLLLLCYPSEFRLEYGDEMTRTFRQQHRQALGARGLSGIALPWWRVVTDLILVAPKERIHMLLQDIRYAFRTFRANPGFALAAVLTITLGIGANTAIFSVVNGILLQPLPYPDPDRLAMVYLNEAERNAPFAHMSVADYLDWRTHDRSFEATAAFGAFGNRFNLTGGGEPEQVRGTYATAGFFSILGAKPVAGRLFGRCFFPCERHPRLRGWQTLSASFSGSWIGRCPFPRAGVLMDC